MKKITAIVYMLFISALTLGQNSLSVDADQYIKITYEGKENGKHLISVINKQGCTADVQFNLPGATSISPNPKNTLNHNSVSPGINYFFVEGNISEFKIIALSICQWKGSAPKWLTVQPPTITPIRYIEGSAKVRIKKIIQ